MKKLLRSAANRLGYDVHKLPEAMVRFIPDEVGKLDLYKTPQGNFYVPRDAPYDVIVDCIKKGKAFEPEIVETASRFIKPGEIVLDVGANFGQMSVMFSKMIGESGDVYSFEADDFVFDILKKNIDANGCANITPIFGAVFNEGGKELFFPKQDFERFASYGSYGLDPKAVSGRKVTSIKIDDIDFKKPISFMKVDVQGSDLFAMQGARETIGHHQMPIIFEFEQQFQDEFRTSFQDYVEFVDSIDYKFTEVVSQINYLITPK